MKTYENKDGYCFFQGEPTLIGKRVTLEIVVMLDSVPGAFHQVEDHINHLMLHPYVQQISVKES